MCDEAHKMSRAPSNSNISDVSAPPFASEELTKMKVKELKVLLVERKLKEIKGK